MNESINHSAILLNYHWLNLYTCTWPPNKSLTQACKFYLELFPYFEYLNPCYKPVKFQKITDEFFKLIKILTKFTSITPSLLHYWYISNPLPLETLSTEIVIRDRKYKILSENFLLNPLPIHLCNWDLHYTSINFQPVR
jgi:hypothetical protein